MLLCCLDLRCRLLLTLLQEELLITEGVICLVLHEEDVVLGGATHVSVNVLLLKKIGPMALMISLPMLQLFMGRNQNWMIHMRSRLVCRHEVVNLFDGENATILTSYLAATKDALDVVVDREGVLPAEALPLAVIVLTRRVVILEVRQDGLLLFVILLQPLIVLKLEVPEATAMIVSFNGLAEDVCVGSLEASTLLKRLLQLLSVSYLIVGLIVVVV